MAVPKSLRVESPAQFIQNALELEDVTMTICNKIPKSEMFILKKDLIDLAKDVYNNVIRANNIHVIVYNDLLTRRQLLQTAYGDIKALLAQMEVARRRYGFDLSINLWQRWLSLVDSECRLLEGIMKSDMNRHSKLLNPNC